jgi:hypothetical protein
MGRQVSMPFPETNESQLDKTLNRIAGTPLKPR